MRQTMSDFVFKSTRRKNISKFLASTLGGVWTYDRSASWHCDDGIRIVSRCSSGSCNDDDDGRWPPHYWLYGDGIPKRIWV